MNSDLEQVFGSASAALRSGNESEALGLLNQLVNAGDARGAECLGYVYEAKGEVIQNIIKSLTGGTLSR